MVDEETLGGRFSLGPAVASGGMATVHRGVDRETGEAVAIKLLYSNGTIDTERFEREASILAQLSHEAIVRYIAHGVTPSGRLYLVMEWIEGTTLSRRAYDPGLCPDEGIAVVRCIAAALAELHQRGLVHRDVKPANVLLQQGDIGRIKLIDFGISRTAGSGSVTRTGHMVGTLGYMAPEQARGERLLDARVDVFALGCMLYECLTGQALFTGATPLVVQARLLFEDPPPLEQALPSAPPLLADLIGRMLAKDPDHRPPDASAVAAALAAVGPIPGPRRRHAEASETEVLEGSLGQASSASQLHLLPRGAEDAGLMSVILAELVGKDAIAGAATLDLTALDERARDLDAAARPHGGQVELLSDGSVVAVVVSQDDAAGHAARAARCALALRPLVGAAQMILVTGRRASVGGESFESLVDRGARAVAVAAVLSRHRGARPDRSPGAGVLLDTFTAGLVDLGFIVSPGKGGAYLHGERSG
jgi:hypothetical protein